MSKTEVKTMALMKKNLLKCKSSSFKMPPNKSHIKTLISALHLRHTIQSSIMDLKAVRLQTFFSLRLALWVSTKLTQLVSPASCKPSCPNDQVRREWAGPFFFLFVFWVVWICGLFWCLSRSGSDTLRISMPMGSCTRYPVRASSLGLVCFHVSAHV